MTWLRQRPVQFGVAALLLVYLVFRLTKSTEVSALVISEQEYKPLLQISGEVIPVQDSQLSAAIAGQITNITVTVGQRVNKGDLLVALDDTSVRLAMEQAESDLLAARLNLEKARSLEYQSARRDSVEDQQDLAQAEDDLKRLMSLNEAGAASGQELENAQRAVATAQERAEASRLLLESYTAGGTNLALLENQVHTRELALQQARLNLDNYLLIAPFPGTVLEIQTEEGERVTVGQKLVRLGAGSGLEVKINPDQQYKDMISPGMAARVWLPQTPDQAYAGKVTMVEPAADPALGTMGARIVMEKSANALNPGSLVTVQLTAMLPIKGVLLEDKWLVTLEGKTGAWVLQDHVAHFRSLTLGTRGSWGVVVKQGLKKGDVVLLPGEIKDGQKVKPDYTIGGSKS